MSELIFSRILRLAGSTLQILSIPNEKISSLFNEYRMAIKVLDYQFTIAFRALGKGQGSPESWMEDDDIKVRVKCTMDQVLNSIVDFAQKDHGLVVGLQSQCLVHTSALFREACKVLGPDTTSRMATVFLNNIPSKSHLIVYKLSVAADIISEKEIVRSTTAQAITLASLLRMMQEYFRYRSTSTACLQLLSMLLDACLPGSDRNRGSVRFGQEKKRKAWQDDLHNSLTRFLPALGHRVNEFSNAADVEQVERVSVSVSFIALLNAMEYDDFVRALESAIPSDYNLPRVDEVPENQGGSSHTTLSEDTASNAYRVIRGLDMSLNLVPADWRGLHRITLRVFLRSIQFLSRWVHSKCVTAERGDQGNDASLGCESCVAVAVGKEVACLLVSRLAEILRISNTEEEEWATWTYDAGEHSEGGILYLLSDLWDSFSVNTKYELGKVVFPGLVVIMTMGTPSLRLWASEWFRSIAECEAEFDSSFESLERVFLDTIVKLFMDDDKSGKPLEGVVASEEVVDQIEELESIISKSFSSASLGSKHQVGDSLHRMTTRVGRVLTQLKERASIPAGQEWEDERVSTTLAISDSLKSFGLQEKYLECMCDVWQLNDMNANWIQAGHCVMRLAEDFTFSETLVPKAHTALPEQSSSERLIHLFRRAHDYFKNGKNWERAIDVLQILKSYYVDNDHDCGTIASLLRRESELYEALATEDRFIHLYAIVEYYGGGFPATLRKRKFVYRGFELERIRKFITRLQNKFPNAKILTQSDFDKMASDDLDAEDMQHILVKTVVPSSMDEYLQESSKARGDRVSTTQAIAEELDSKIAEYRKADKVDVFCCTTPVKRPLEKARLGEEDEKPEAEKALEKYSGSVEGGPSAEDAVYVGSNSDHASAVRVAGNDSAESVLDHNGPAHSESDACAEEEAGEHPEADSWDCKKTRAGAPAGGKQAVSRPQAVDGERDKEVNNLRSTWLRRTFHITVDQLPNILCRSEIKEVRNVEVSPVDIAISAMEEKNEQLKATLLAHKKGWDKNLNKLTMSLNGVIDAEVNGGTKLYQKAFFTPIYVEAYPAHRPLVCRLLSTLEESIFILEDALYYHGEHCDEKMRPLQDKLETFFERMRHAVESLEVPSPL